MVTGVWIGFYTPNKKVFLSNPKNDRYQNLGSKGKKADFRAKKSSLSDSHHVLPTTRKSRANKLKTKCHCIILCLGMREPWPEKCWQIKKHRELEQTIAQQRICPDYSELLRRTKVVAARQTLSSTRGFICCVREVISWYNDISFRGGNFLNSTHLFALIESLGVNWLNHLKWPTPKDFRLLVPFSANGGTNSMQGRR